MAATVASLGSAFTTTAGNKTVTATPTNGDLIVIIAVATGVTTTVADNATGGTYTQVDSTRTGFSTTGNLQVFVRNALVTGAASTVYTATQTSSTGGGMVILRVTGMSLTGAAAVRSSGGQSTVAAGTPAPVLSNTPSSSNPIITAMANSTSSSTTNVVQRTGYTEDFDNGYNTPPTGLEVSHLNSGETSATLTYGGATGSQFASIAIELAYNTAPTVALNTPADTATGVSTTPDLAFTGTDVDSDTIEYEVQVDTNNTFGAVIASYTATPNTSFFGLGDTTSYTAIGIQITGNGNTIGSGVWKLLKSTGSPTGNAYCKIYSISGSAVGSLLATSDPLDVSTLTTTATDTTLIFSGANQITLTNATNYLFVIEYSDGSSTNKITFRYDNTVGKTVASFFNGAWSTVISTASTGYYFLLYTPPLIDKFSVTPDATFTDVTNGAHTHPFPSGEQVKYTVQAGDTLTGSTVYYWRARGKDPSGANTNGAWATTQSFTTGSSGIDLQRGISDLQNSGGTNAIQAPQRASYY